MQHCYADYKLMVTCLKNTKLQLFIICVLTLLAYSNIFANAFATDDIGYFYNWDIPKHIENIPKIFTTDSVPKDEQGVYRPGKALLIMLSYKLWGLNLTGYHLFSLFMHLSATVLVYFRTRQLILAPGVKKMQLHPRGGHWLAFITALLFGLHPIHTEAITFVLASYDSAGLTLFLLSFWLYLLVQRDTPEVKKMRLHLRGEKTWLYFVSIISAAAAFLTYEMTFTLPLVIMLYHFCFRKKLAARIVPYWLILAGALLLRVFLLHIPPRGQYLGGDFYLTMLIMTKAFIKYIQLLILPLNLNLDHQVAPGIYSVIYPAYVNLETLRSQSIFNPDILANILLIGSLLVVAFWYYKKSPLVTFTIVWFFITLLPVANIIPQGQIFAERYLYLPSFGFYLLLGLFFREVIRRIRLIGLIGLIGLLVFYFYQTYQRNKDWKDTLTVWQKLAVQNPDHPIINFTLAKIYKEKDMGRQAVFYFNKTLELDPNLNEAKLSANFFQNNNFSFFYPKDWKIQNDIGVKIINNQFEVNFDLDNLGDNLIEDYLKNQKSFGSLENQGLVKLPNFESGYVKIWKSRTDMKLYQFFLFKQNKVIQVIINPMDLQQKDNVDAILKSLKLR